MTAILALCLAAAAVAVLAYGVWLLRGVPEQVMERLIKDRRRGGWTATDQIHHDAIAFGSVERSLHEICGYLRRVTTVIERNDPKRPHLPGRCWCRTDHSAPNGQSPEVPSE